ncbi:PLDc N-terminal domain-containing protein [Curtobacterium luteum]|uniref:Uncharacterized protein n=1 Tax=Curtobacterium luteum TaxID=33881 RepID=A0A175S2D9_9MICO|nr:PLDc N-terminal domain-containing protein [Curtobacterium luteum]KTR09350.1 hypothetical protein NS184_03070 [Curtobacterium luteum]
METSNPLVPATYDLVWSVVAVITVALAVVASVSLSRAARRLSPWLAFAWAALIVLVPVLGAVAWLGVGRRTEPGVRPPR